MNLLLLLWILAASCIAFVMYGVDKWNAQRGAFRIAENKLHIIAIFGGWPGAALARQLFRHKTQKATFIWRFWVTGIMFAIWVSLAFFRIVEIPT